MTLLVIGAIGYVVIRSELSNKIVEQQIDQELSRMFNTEISIGSANINGLNMATFGPIVIYDQQGDTLLAARRAMASFEIWPIIHNRRLILNTIQLIDFDIRCKQDSLAGRPNFMFIVDALAPQDSRQENLLSEFQIGAIFLRQGRVSYDILDIERRTDGKLDPYHFAVRDLSANLGVHYIPEKGTHVDVRRLEIEEQNGLRLARSRFMLDVVKQDIIAEGVFSLLVRSPQVFLPSSLPFDNPLALDVSFLASLDSIHIPSVRLTDHDSLHIESQLHILLPERFDTRDAWKKISFTADVRSCRIPHALLPQQQFNIDFNGKISGDPNRIVASGHNRSDISPIEAYDLGPSSADVDFNLVYAPPTKKWEFSAKGNLPLLTYRNYTYHDIHFEATSADDLHTLIAHLDDANGQADLALGADMSHARPELTVQAQFRNFAPNAVRLLDLKNTDSLWVSCDIDADLKGNNLKDLTGHLFVDAIRLRRPLSGEHLSIDPVRFYIGRLNDRASASIHSPLVRIEYRQNEAKRHRFDGVVQPYPQLMSMLRVPVRIGENLPFFAELDSAYHLMRFQADIPQTQFPAGDISGQITVADEGNDFLSSHVGLDFQTSKYTLAATLNALVSKDLRNIRLKPGILMLNGNEFETSAGHILRGDSGQIFIDHISLKHEEQGMEVSGQFGTGHDGIVMSLNRLELNPLLMMFGKQYLDFGGAATGDIHYAQRHGLPHVKTDGLIIDGFSYQDKILGRNNFSMDWNLNAKLLKIGATILTEEQRYSHLDFDLKMGRHDTLDLRGNLDRLPLDFLDHWVGGILQQFQGYGSGYVRLFGDAKKLNLLGSPMVDASFTHSLLGTRFHMNDIVYLTHDDVSPTADIRKIKPSQLRRDGHIQLRQAAINDGQNHTLRTTADIRHRSLGDYRYNVEIRIPQTPQGFLVFNHPEQKEGGLYWGQLYATGQCLIQGGDGRHHFLVNLKTADRSQFFLSPGEEHPMGEEDSYSILTYRDKRSLSLNPDQDPVLFHAATADAEGDGSDTYIECDINIQATDRCLVNVQMDPLADDRLLCRGFGDIAIHYDPRHDLSILGQYNITQGSYTLTMRGDLMTKAFVLQEGSHVRFTGQPSQAELNLDARYSIPSVNLSDLDESFASLASMSRTSLPVDCKLKVSGPISAPQIGFDLEVKNVSEDVQALVHNLIGTQEMRNQQVFYLLLFSKFYTPEYATSSQNNTGSELSSFASASITSQLNNFLNRMSDRFSLGTNFRSEKGDFSDMEMDVAISTRLFSDRLILNGNLGYRDPASRIGMSNNTNSFIGDFDAEYLINSTGTVRAKAYSHYNERDYSINNALTTQGIGIILRRDFRSFWELWKKNKAWKQR